MNTLAIIFICVVGIFLPVIIGMGIVLLILAGILYGGFLVAFAIAKLTGYTKPRHQISRLHRIVNRPGVG